MADNLRSYYAIKQLCMAPPGTTTYTAAHAVKGLQSAGLNLRLNQEQYFEFGQAEVYDFAEGIPEVELTMEKLLDGHPLMYHLATLNAPSASLQGRSRQKTSVVYDIFTDTQDSASGTPISEMYASGMVVSSLGYNFPNTGAFTETLTLVGNDKLVKTAGFYATGFFDGSGIDGDPTDETSPLAPEGVNTRQHFLFGVPASGYVPSIMPKGATGIEGIDTNGYNPSDGDGGYKARITSVRVSANLGREDINQLGKRAPYARLINPNIEVTCDIESNSTSGDMTEATSAGILPYGRNTVNQHIFIAVSEGTQIDLGTKCRLRSSNFGNGNATGGNDTISRQYVTYNKMTVQHPNDPTVALRP